MKLYYTPGACSLGPHIAAREAGLELALEKVDLKEKRTETGRDYREINPMGAVPALELDNGEVLTEAAVVQLYLAAQKPEAHLAPTGEGLEHWRFLSLMNFIATELHKGFGPLFKNPSPELREATLKMLANRFALLAEKLGDKPYLTGDHFTVADSYAYVTLNWARSMKIDLSGLPTLQAYFRRMMERPAVQQALREEGLPTS